MFHETCQNLTWVRRRGWRRWLPIMPNGQASRYGMGEFGFPKRRRQPGELCHKDFLHVQCLYWPTKAFKIRRANMTEAEESLEGRTIVRRFSHKYFAENQDDSLASSLVVASATSTSANLVEQPPKDQWMQLFDSRIVQDKQ